MQVFVSDIRGIKGAGAAQSALVRALLAYGLGMRELPEMEKTPKGKPFFPDRPDIQFSLSHTDTHILAAVSEYDLGADIQTIRPVPKAAGRLFSREMYEAFGYHGAWALREAAYKLTGEGSLRKIDIRCVDGDIVTPWPDVRCCLMDYEGCALALACRDGEFPTEPISVPAELFLPESLK